MTDEQKKICPCCQSSRCNRRRHGARRWVFWEQREDQSSLEKEWDEKVYVDERSDRGESKKRGGRDRAIE